MKPAAGSVAGAAALKAARASLVPFAELHPQVSSIQGHDTAPALHVPTQISPDTQNLPTLHPSLSSPRSNDTSKRPLAPIYAEIAAYGIANNADSPAPSVDRAQSARTVKHRHFSMFLTLDALYSSSCASLVLTGLLS